MQTARLTRTWLVPAGSGVSTAEEWLAGAATGWGLSGGHARRWAAALSRELPSEQDVELFAEYDPVTELATIELWVNGRVIFGIDDWLGLW